MTRSETVTRDINCDGTIRDHRRNIDDNCDNSRQMLNDLGHLDVKMSRGISNIVVSTTGMT